MAIPSEYQQDQGTNSANIKHPIITFKVLMNRHTQEVVGPLTNSRTGDVLHPDMYQSSPDLGRTNAANHETQFSPWMPNSLRNNIVDHGDGTFTAYGSDAIYLKTQYADIDNPLLEIMNAAPYTTA